MSLSLKVTWLLKISPLGTLHRLWRKTEWDSSRCFFLFFGLQSNVNNHLRLNAWDEYFPLSSVIQAFYYHSLWPVSLSVVCNHSIYCIPIDHFPFCRLQLTFSFIISVQELTIHAYMKTAMPTQTLCLGSLLHPTLLSVLKIWHYIKTKLKQHAKIYTLNGPDL